MAGGAGESPLTCTKTVKGHVVVDSHVQQVVTVLGLVKCQVTVALLTGNMNDFFENKLNVVEVFEVQGFTLSY